MPGQTESPFEGPHAPSVDVGALVTDATQTELSSQRLVQLSHSYFDQLVSQSMLSRDTHEGVQRLQSTDCDATME